MDNVHEIYSGVFKISLYETVLNITKCWFIHTDLDKICEKEKLKYIKFFDMMTNFAKRLLKIDN